LILSISDKNYKCPSEWSEVKYSQYLKITDFVHKKAPDKLRKMLYDKSFEDEITPEEELSHVDFYRQLICEVAGVPEEVSNHIHVHGQRGGIGIIPMANIILRFIYLPYENSIKTPDSFKYKGKTYHLFKRYKGLMGDEVFFKDQTFKEYEELQAVKQHLFDFDNLEVNALALLTAILYRPKGEGYDSEKVKARARHFADLRMTYIWGAYFFFRVLTTILSASTHNSTKERAEETLLSTDTA